MDFAWKNILQSMNSFICSCSSIPGYLFQVTEVIVRNCT
jgi:hypothetical protein